MPVREGEIELVRTVRSGLRAGVLRAGKGSRKAIDRVLARYSKIGNPPVFDPASFPWTRALEDNWEAIRDEGTRMLRLRELLPPLHEISPDHDRLTSDGKWKVFFLKGYGYWFPKNCAACPRTERLVRAIPGVESAFFSILEAGMHIRKHRGPTKSIFTCHLGLEIPPTEECWIKVDHQKYFWTEGKTFLFDDTFKHEVKNASDRDRVILLLHVRRPLRFPGKVVGSGIFQAIKHSPFVQDARRNQARWEERFRVAEKSAGFVAFDDTGR